MAPSSPGPTRLTFQMAGRADNCPEAWGSPW